TGKKTTTTGAVYRLTGSANASNGNTAPPLTFSAPSKVLDTTAPASGIVFDVVGNLIVASDSRLDSVPSQPLPLYSSSPTSLIGSGIAAVGVAVNTCKQVVYADSATNTIRRVGSSQVLASFSDIPLYLEIDSSNVLYVVTGPKLDGTGAAKVWKVDLGFATVTCTPSAPVTPVLVADLKTALP